MATEYYEFPLGDFRCISVLDGEMDYDLEAMVKNAPRADVEEALKTHHMPVDAIVTPYAYLLVDTGQHRVLVDMGAGSLADSTGRLIQNLRCAGIAPESINSIFITHAHPDHVGGALNEQGEPAFPAAVHYISKTEWDYWFSTLAETQAPRFTAIARKNLSPLKDCTVLIELEGEVLPGVRVLFAPGHTPGHMVVSFASGEEVLLYIGDTVIHPLHLEHPDWLPVYDMLAEQAETSKRRIFDLAASTGCWVIGQHFSSISKSGPCGENQRRLGMAAHCKGRLNGPKIHRQTNEGLHGKRSGAGAFLLRGDYIEDLCQQVVIVSPS